VAENDIWNESPLAQIQSESSHFLRVENRSFGLAQVMMDLGRNCAPWLVDDFAHAGQVGILSLGDEDRLVARLAAEVAGEMQVLSWKILVYEENVHCIRAPRCFTYRAFNSGVSSASRGRGP
jgi:hypothetical protein